MSTDLTTKKCRPCEGGVPPLSPAEVRDLLTRVPQWHLTPDGQRIRREWRVKNFVTALDFLHRVGEIAAADGHHPDMHLVGSSKVAIVLWSHDITGFTENTFI